MKVNWWFLLVIWVKWKQVVCSMTLLYSSTFYCLFLPFFVLEIFKFKCDTLFVRNSAAISKFDWFEQLCYIYQDSGAMVQLVKALLLAPIYSLFWDKKFPVFDGTQSQSPDFGNFCLEGLVLTMNSSKIIMILGFAFHATAKFSL